MQCVGFRVSVQGVGSRVMSRVVQLLRRGRVCVETFLAPNPLALPARESGRLGPVMAASRPPQFS
mgnify:CR=1 FL=1